MARPLWVPWLLGPLWAVYRFVKKRVARLVGLLLTLVCLVLGTMAALLQSEPFARFVVERALPAVNDALPGEIRVGAYRGALGSRFELDDVAILDEMGDPFITAERIALRWEFWDLLVRDVSAREVVVTRPVVRLKQRAEGGLNVVRAFVKPGPPKERVGKGQKPIPIDIEVARVAIEGGTFTLERADGTAIVDVRGIDLDAGYSLRGFEHDAAFRRLGAHLHAPIAIPRAEISGGARMDAYDLDVDDLLVRWKEDALRLDGTLGPVRKLKPDLAVAIERFDLADVAEFAPKAPVRGVVRGTLQLTGRLADLHASGLLAVEGGGSLEAVDLGVRLGKPLGHVAELRLDGFDLAAILDVPGLPPPLTGHVRWEGEGTGLDTLVGEAGVELAPLRYQGLDLGPVDVVARLQDSVVTVQRGDVGLAGATPRLVGDLDLRARCFDVRLGGGIGSLGRLRERIRVPFTRGAVSLDLAVDGCWGTETSAVALRAKGRVGLRDLAMTPADLSVASGTIDLDVAVDARRGGGVPDVRGPVTVVVTDLVAAKQVVSGARLDATLAGHTVGVVLAATSGPDLGLDLLGGVDWGALPAVALRSESLGVRFRTLRLATTQSFDLKLNQGRVEASGLVAASEGGGKLIVQGTLAPGGAADALVRLLSFDLVQVDGFLPEDGKLRGTLEDLTVKVAGTLANPSITLRTRLRQWATRGRGPIDLDVDLALADRKLTGLAALPGLLELEIADLPLHVHLDGGGGLPFWLPEASAWDVELRVPDGRLDRLHPALGKPLPAAYVGGKVRGAVKLTGTTSEPVVDGAFFLRDLVVDLQRLEARTGAEAAADRTSESREVNLRAAYSLRDGIFALRDTQLRTNKEGTVLELGASARTALGAVVMGRVGPRERRTTDVPPLLEGLSFEAGLRRLPMALVHLVAPVSEPVAGALEGTITLAGDLSAPSVGANVHLLGGRIGERPLKKAAVAATIEGGALTGLVEVVPAILPSELEQEQAGKDKPGKRGRKERAKRSAPAGTASAEGIEGVARKRGPLVEDDEEARAKARALLDRSPSAGRLALRVAAPLPLALDGSRTVRDMLGQPGLKGVLDSDAFPLPVALAFVPGALDASGEVVLEGTITGSLLAPRPDVRLSLQDGRFVYAKTSVSYEDIDVDVALTPEALVVREIALDTLPLIRNPLDLVFKPNVTRDTRVQGKRSLSITGRANLDGWALADVSIRLAANRFWGMYTQEIKAQVGAELEASGRWPDVAVRGTLDVDEVNVELGQEAMGRDVGDMALPEDVYVHRTTSRPGPGERRVSEQVAREAAQERPTLFQRLDTDVLVRLGNKVHVKLAVGLARGRDDALRALNLIGNIEPDVNLGGEVRVLMTGGKPRLVGTLETTRDSKLTALTKRFDVTPGSSLTMLGDLGDSNLSIDAAHQSRYGTIVVSVRGSMAEPEITFSSEEIPDQGDIMVVLLTGKPLSEQTAAEGGSAMRTISSALAGFGTKLLGKYTPLDKLDIDLGDGTGSGSVEAGKAITPELFLVSRFRWGVRDERENRVEAALQFQPRVLRRFALEGSIGDRLAGGVQVVWRLIY